MLEAATGLTDEQLEAIADLERRTVAADGGRLKLEWETLRSRSAARIEDLLWWQDGDLLGFLGLYAFGATAIELAGMVRPDARRRGIGTALLDAALPLCRARGSAILLVAPRTSEGARALAHRRDGILDHSEFALELTGDPTPGPADPKLKLRPMTGADIPRVNDLLRAGFGHQPVSDDGGPDPATIVAEAGGTVIGSLRVTHDSGGTGIYGFVIDPALRGQGIGRDVLRRVCQQARAQGEPAHLEVATHNDHALSLYTSLGFTPVAIEDYYALS